MNMVNPKKSLGQHFLTDNNIAQNITNSLINESNYPVIELGPGTGILTQYLQQRFDNLTLIEIDSESINYLQEQYSNEKVNIIHADFLKAELNKMLISPTCLIGNFPYNISSQIFFRILDYHNNIPETVCMVQDEVARRLAASEGNKTYGILSVLLQTWYNIEYLFAVSPKVFYPQPKVKSAVIRLTRNERKSIDCEWNFYKSLVKTAFNQRRKTLRNALKPINISLDKIDNNILDKRAEQLSVYAFIDLANELSGLE
jgi:16S rRNA (adenine1518-N6/adenine1519-N6)-dimethyltransferase